jgi:hypothetical protein
MYTLSKGSGRYLPYPMSAYRTFSLNSWSSTNTGNNGAARLKNATSMIHYLEKMQEEYAFKKYDFSPKIGVVYFNISIACLLMGDFVGFRKAIVNCKKAQTHLGIKHSLFYCARRFPRFAILVYKVKLRLYS